MNVLSSLFSPLTTVFAVALLLILPACEVIDQRETITLRPSHSFEFVFDVSPGDNFVSAHSADAVAVSTLLQDTFRPGEVISATVSSVELSRRIPAGRSLSSIFDSATLDLLNGRQVTVAAMPSPPNAQSGDMNVSGQPEIATLLQGNQIRAFMELDLAADESEQYTIRANVVFRIEVEGV